MKDSGLNAPAATQLLLHGLGHAQAGRRPPAKGALDRPCQQHLQVGRLPVTL